MLSSSVSEHLREITQSQQPSLASRFCIGKKQCLRTRKSRSVLCDSATRTHGECAEDGWIGGTELLWIKETPLSVEVFQQPHHNHSLIITQLIQNSACSAFSTNVLRYLTDGEKWTTGKMLVPDYSDSSRARAAVLGPGSRTINSLRWTWGSLARKVLCLSGFPQPTDLLWRTTACHLLSSPALQAYISETSTDYVLPRCSTSPPRNAPLYPLPAHTPGPGKVDEVHLEIPSSTLEQVSKLSGQKKSKDPQDLRLLRPSLTRMVLAAVLAQAALTPCPLCSLCHPLLGLPL